MQRPKQLVICGKTCEVTYTDDEGGGETDLSNGHITVGAGIPSEALEVLMHEASEYILYLQGHRYTRYAEGNDGVIFHMKHHDFENYIKEFTFVIEQIFGIKQIKKQKAPKAPKAPKKAK